MSGRDGTAIGDAIEAQLRRTNWPAMVGLGAGVFVVGLVLTAVLVFGFGNTPTGGPGGAVLVVGFTFYAANLVRLDIGGVQVDFFAGVGETAVPLVVYYAVPMVVLLAAGVVATEQFSTGEVDPVGLATNVLGIAAGYALVAVVGTFVLVTGTVTGGSASLVLVDAVLFGLAYPLVFGTIGAALATARQFLR